MQVEPSRAGRKEWQKGVVKSRINKRSYEVELPQGLLRRNRVELCKSNETPIKVEDDDVIEAHKQLFTETREDTREQAPPDTRLETFDQPRPLHPILYRHGEGPRASVSRPSVYRTICLLKPKNSFQRTEFHEYVLSRLFWFHVFFSVKLFSYFSIKWWVL